MYLKNMIITYNHLINLLKYPMMIILLLSLPYLVPKLFHIIEIMVRRQGYYYSLVLGMGIYVVLWKVLFKNIGDGLFATLEHELTHILFALATFHKVTGINATAGAGGHMTYSGVGGGNWLITISPYFFPTLSVFILGLMYMMPTSMQDVMLGVLGASMAYHTHSTWNETHYGQSDLKEVGFSFVWLFLPAANITSSILLLSIIPHDKIYLSVVFGKYLDYVMGIVGIIV